MRKDGILQPDGENYTFFINPFSLKGNLPSDDHSVRREVVFLADFISIKLMFGESAAKKPCFLGALFVQ